MKWNQKLLQLGLGTCAEASDCAAPLLRLVCPAARGTCTVLCVLGKGGIEVGQQLLCLLRMTCLRDKQPKLCLQRNRCIAHFLWRCCSCWLQHLATALICWCRIICRCAEYLGLPGRMQASIVMLPSGARRPPAGCSVMCGCLGWAETTA